MFSVPVIAFAVASGSAYAMTAVAEGVSGLSKRAAREAAADMSYQRGAQSVAGDGVRLNDLGTREKDLGNKGALDSYLAESIMESTQAESTLKFIKSFGATSGQRRMASTDMAKRDAFNLGKGHGFKNMEDAFNAGMVKTQVASGQATGLQIAAHQEGTTVRGSAQKTASWQNLESFARSKAGQSLADQYFGGNTAALANFMGNVEMSGRFGGDVGGYEAYQAALKDGFKGSYADYEKFQTKLHSENVFGQNVGVQKGADMTTNGDVIRFIEPQRFGSGLKSFASGQATINAVERYGLNTLFRAENNEVSKSIEQGANLAPTAEQAGNMGAWAGQVENRNWQDNKAIYGTPQNQVDVTKAQEVMSRFAPQVQNAIVNDSPAVVKSMNAQLKPAMKQLGSYGASYEASMVTNEEAKLLKGSIKSTLQTDSGRHMLGQLAASLAVETKTGFELVGNGIDIKAATKGQLEQKIDNVLKSSNGLDVGTNIVSQTLQQKNFEIATKNPDNAFIEQKQYFDNLQSSIQSGNIDKAASLLGVGNERQTLNDKYHEGATPGNMVNDMYYDGKATTEQYLKDLKNTFEPHFNESASKGEEKVFGESASEIGGSSKDKNENVDEIINKEF